MGVRVDAEVAESFELESAFGGVEVVGVGVFVCWCVFFAEFGEGWFEHGVVDDDE